MVPKSPAIDQYRAALPQRVLGNSSAQRHFSFQVNNQEPDKIYGKLPTGEVEEKFWLTIEDSTIMRIKFLQMKDSEKYGCLRILVEGGGCSGFSYAFDVISMSEVDEEEAITFEKDGIKVVSDEMTLEMINGSKVEYKEEMIRSAFEITENPMADGGCSCGVSFTPKDL